MSKKRGQQNKKSATPKKSNRKLVIIIAAAAAIAAAITVAVLRSRPPEPVRATENNAAENKPVQAQRVSYEVVASHPHDPAAFLQGLVWHDGGFYESTGQYGASSLRRVEYPSGKVVKQVKLSTDFFGEGLALVDDRLVQLTWTTKRGFVYERETLKQTGEFTYQNEGWGLTYDGKDLIMSDGSDRLTYLDAATYQPKRVLKVTRDGRAVMQLNELEYIEGEIWANVWHQDVILRIDPATGQVTKFIDLRGIIDPAKLGGNPEAVLNGIAYDAGARRVFVSGKLWPQIFEIRVKE